MQEMSSYGPPSPGVALHISESAHKHKSVTAAVCILSTKIGTRAGLASMCACYAGRITVCAHITSKDSSLKPRQGFFAWLCKNGAPWTCAHPPISQSSAREWREHFHSQTSITRCVVYFRENWTLSRLLPTIRLTTPVAVVSFSVLHGRVPAQKQVQRRSPRGIEGL